MSEPPHIACPRPLLKSKHRALALAAAAIVSHGQSGMASAEELTSVPTVTFRYSEYRDFQSDHQKRMTVRSPQSSFAAPLSEKSDLSVSALLDTMSGASPTYLNSLSGASGLGIQDNRTAINLRYRTLGERSLSSFSYGFSDEDDYKAHGLGYAGHTFFDSRQTAVTYTVSGSLDEVSSTNDPGLHEHRNAFSVSIGLQRVLTKKTSISVDLQGWARDGYLTDPYKYFDNRPATREGISLAARLATYEADLGTAFQLSAVYGQDSWGMASFALEGAAAMQLSEGLFVTPSIRLKNQSAAKFFGDVPEDFNISPGFFSADQRLGRFGSVSIGLTISQQLGDSWTVDVGGEFAMQRTEWALGPAGLASIEPFYTQLLSFGVTRKFK